MNPCIVLRKQLAPIPYEEALAEARSRVQAGLGEHEVYELRATVSPQLRAIAQITYLVPPASLTQVGREKLADLLSGYAADIRKGGSTGGHYVQFEISEDD